MINLHYSHAYLSCLRVARVYRKWNQRLFNELAKAYEDGRATQHPVEFWFDGEIGFFDYYIIPLAKKLADCGVFGVSSDEYLSYAVQNRNEWSLRGKEIVEEYLEQLATEKMNSEIKLENNDVVVEA